MIVLKIIKNNYNWIPYNNNISLLIDEDGRFNFATYQVNSY